MNTLDLILQSIRDKASTEENQIINAAKDQASSILEESSAKAKAEAEEITEKANKEAKLILENEKVSAKREARDLVISGKNQVIDEVLEKLISNLKNMDKDSYKKFVLNTIQNSNIEKGEILLQKNLKDALTETDLKGLTISDESVDEGFIIRDGKIEYDNRFSSLVKYKMDDIKKQISDSLFKWGD